MGLKRIFAIVFVAAGVFSLLYGITQIYEPAAWIVAGLAWLAIGLFAFDVGGG